MFVESRSSPRTSEGKKDEEEEKQCCVLEAYKIGGRGKEEEEETGGQRDGVTLSFSYQHCDRREAKGAQSSESGRHSTVSPKDTRGPPSLAGERGKISVTNQTVHCGGRAGVTPPLSFRFKREGGEVFGVSGTGGSLNLGKGSGKVGGHITRVLVLPTTKRQISIVERSESCQPVTNEQIY